MKVRWGNTFSEWFSVKNGVRQGGVLSPILFDVYVDVISVTLNNMNIGCVIGNLIINHLFYADDLVLISPSRNGLQRLVNICYKLGIDLDIKYNEKKTMCVIFYTKRDQSYEYLLILLNNKSLLAIDTKRAIFKTRRASKYFEMERPEHTPMVITLKGANLKDRSGNTSMFHIQ